MRLTLLFALVLLVLPGCRRDAPEGVYPCTVASDCPAMWVCRADMRCWSRESVVDAGTDGAIASDGGPPSDTGVDAPMSDTGPHCGAETCNGSDDDCDGLIDEGVMTVGPAVRLSSAMNAQGATLVAVPGGFGALVATPSADATYVTASWQPMGTSGTPGIELPLGADLAHGYPGIDATLLDNRVAFSLIDSMSNRRVLVGFDATSGMRTTGSAPFPIPVPSTREATALASLVPASAHRLTAYVAHASTTTNDNHISRMHIDVGTPTPTVMNDYEIVTDAQSTAFAILSTHDVDYVLYQRTDGRVVLVAGPSGDATGPFHLVGPVGGTTPPFFDYASMAIRDPGAAVSATNPLGIAWAGRAGVGSRATTVSFLEVANTTVFSASTLVSFPDAVGSWGGFFTARTIHLLALPDAPEHWILVNQDGNALPLVGGLVQVRELIGPASTIRRISVPGETVGPRTDIGLAVSGTSIRILEGDGAGLVTRSIGCE